jgi:hypothetical protein
MWYNRIVLDDNNKVIDKERYFVDKDKVWEVYNGLGMDIMGNYIMEYWE